MPAPRPRHARATPAPLSCDPWDKEDSVHHRPAKKLAWRAGVPLFLNSDAFNRAGGDRGNSAQAEIGFFLLREIEFPLLRRRSGGVVGITLGWGDLKEPTGAGRARWQAMGGDTANAANPVRKR
eukprot:gene24851-biopygen16458